MTTNATKVNTVVNAGVKAVKESISSAPSTAQKVLTTFQVSNNTFLYIFGFLFVLAILIGAIVIWSKTLTFAKPSNVMRITKEQVAKNDLLLSPYFKAKRSLQEEPIEKDEKCLINYAPITIYQPGFVGPLKDGVYSEREGVSNALKAGARCFVLPIDYHEDSTLDINLFHKPGMPCMLMRDQSGTIRSLNSGSIEKVANALADLAFSNLIFANQDPIIIVLYFIRTPPPNTKEYLRFCSQVAKELGPLVPYILGQTSEGVYNRQGRQNQLLYSSLSNFSGKSLIFCNLDLTLFRDTRSVGLAPFQPREDLDYLTHLQLFKERNDEQVGATLMADSNQFPRGFIQRPLYFNSIPENRVKDAIDITKIRWSIVLPPYGKNQTSDYTKEMLDKYGVQAVCMYTFDLESEDNKALMNLWKQTAWRAKPKDIRFVLPKPFKPMQPSPKVNAMGGNLTSPTL